MNEPVHALNMCTLSRVAALLDDFALAQALAQKALDNVPHHAPILRAVLENIVRNPQSNGHADDSTKQLHKYRAWHRGKHDRNDPDAVMVEP
jgi:hypothetical protein